MNLEQARQFAKDETTLPETLAELAKHEDYLTRQYVAGNPNTPVETLLRICFEFPHEVINNPIISLLPLEDPNILTCKIDLDFNELKNKIDLEIKYLDLPKIKVKAYLGQIYGKRSRLHLTDRELFDLLSRLRSMNINKNSIALIKPTSESWEDELPF